MRLRTGFLAVLLAVALVLSTVVYAGFALHKDEILEQERQSLETDAATVAINLDTRLDEKRAAVSLWADNDAIAAHGSDRQRRALETFRERTAFQGVSIVAANGTMVAFVSANGSEGQASDLVGRDFSDRRYVTEALDGDAYISRPLDAESGNLVVVFSAPIRRDGRIVGTLNGALYPRRTAFFQRATTLLPAARTLTVLSDTNVTLYDRPTDYESPMTATATVDRTGWHVLVAGDRQAVQSQLRRSTGLQVGAVLATLLVVASLGVWASRATIRQIERLADGLDALERGAYDTDVDLGPAAEWQRISDRFGALATTLDRRESQLSVFNRVFRHNLRNDMSVILLSSERIAETTAVPTTEESARRIRRRAESFMATTEHARTIHDELLERGPSESVSAPVTTVVNEAANELQTAYPEATVTVSVDETTTVVGGRRLPLVLSELGTNALAHNDRPPAESRVAIDARRAGESVVISVADNGPGMPTTERELLVGDREETPTAHGTGLGLWLVKWLVASLDGEITVSTPDDGGTTVTLRLPTGDQST